MTTRQNHGPPARTPLTRERVLHAAIAIADEAGVGALSMRKLGQMLGVEAMSLYNHVRSKDDLLNSVIDIVLGEVEIPPAGTPWKRAIRGTAISAHDVLVRHPWAASVMLSATGRQPARWRYMESILRSLREGGFSPERTDHAYHVLDSHITGYTLWQVQIQIDPAQLPAMASTFLQDLPPDDYPFLVEHVHQHLRPPDAADEGAFVFGLDLILDGLERLLPGAGSGLPTE
jgi:AcrR family transcriptional regulator